jgi:hypothetical protein
MTVRGETGAWSREDPMRTCSTVKVRGTSPQASRSSESTIAAEALMNNAG